MVFHVTGDFLVSYSETPCDFLVSESETLCHRPKINYTKAVPVQLFQKFPALQSIKNCFYFNGSSTISTKIVSTLNINPKNVRRIPDLSMLSWTGRSVYTHANMPDALGDDKQGF